MEPVKFDYKKAEAMAKIMNHMSRFPKRQVEEDITLKVFLVDPVDDWRMWKDEKKWDKGTYPSSQRILNAMYKFLLGKNECKDTVTNTGVCCLAERLGVFSGCCTLFGIKHANNGNTWIACEGDLYGFMPDVIFEIKPGDKGFVGEFTVKGE